MNSFLVLAGDGNFGPVNDPRFESVISNYKELVLFFNNNTREEARPDFDLIVERLQLFFGNLVDFLLVLAGTLDGNQVDGHLGLFIEAVIEFNNEIIVDAIYVESSESDWLFRLNFSEKSFLIQGGHTNLLAQIVFILSQSLRARDSAPVSEFEEVIGTDSAVAKTGSALQLDLLCLSRVPRSIFRKFEGEFIEIIFANN